jgi:ADP-L-glycero-D-manno-heptose 6-epimerase
MILVTGGAGFIGSNIVASLARRGEKVALCDWLGSGDKWRNISKHRVYDLIMPDQLDDWLLQNGATLKAIVHMGAISATTEKDADLIVRSNYQLSLKLWAECAKHGWAFIYASSAATYGDGSCGFDDVFSLDSLDRLRPLNPYGWSKHAFDLRICQAVNNRERTPPKWAGLKFFNVYGPNEYHKGSMRSVIARSYESIIAGEPIQLFRSYRSGYDDGGQKRDFIYVADCVDVVLWMLDNDFPSSVYNVGTGKARSWADLAAACFAAADLNESIVFVDMPEFLRERYQYFTEARMTKLRAAGYLRPPLSLEDGITMYWKNYLLTSDIYA